MSTSILAQTRLCVATAVAQAATVYSDSVDFSRCQGNATVWLASTAGTIAVSQQCSLDGVTFYDPVDAAGAALGAIVAAQGVTTGKYVSYSPVLAPWVRFKIIEANAAPTVVNLLFIFREER